MARVIYEKIVDGVSVKVRSIDEANLPFKTATGPDGNPVWRPRVKLPNINNSTPGNPDVLVSPAVRVIEATRITVQQTIRDMTVQEVADRGDNNLAAQWSRFSDDPVLDAIRTVVFRDHNSIRVLEGKSPWTKVQFNTWFKDRLKDSIDSGVGII